MPGRPPGRSDARQPPDPTPATRCAVLSSDARGLDTGAHLVAVVRLGSARAARLLAARAPLALRLCSRDELCSRHLSAFATGTPRVWGSARAPALVLLRSAVGRVRRRAGARLL